MDKLRALSIEARFFREFMSIARSDQKKIQRALEDLRRNPMHSAQPLKGARGIFRCRVDPYRILFAAAPGWVHVYSVQHRRSVYQGEIAQPLGLPLQNAPRWPSPPIEVEPDVPVAVEPQRDDPAEALDWDVIARLVVSRNAEDLYHLIDLGLPTPIFDELFELLHRETDRPAGPRNFRLVREQVIDEFYGRYLLLPETAHPIELTIVSPWLTPWAGLKSSYLAMLQSLRTRPVSTTIVTRPPLLEQHARCVTELAELAGVEIVLLEDLHAKFFVCDIAPVPFALIGSANTTAQSFVNYEVGVFVRGAGEAEAIVRDLQALTVELRAAGKRTKKRGYV